MAALVAAVTAVITTLLTVFVAPRLNYRLETRLLRRRADTEHEFERRRKLRKQIGRYHGRMLSAVDAFSDRLENMTRHQSQGWLNAGGWEDGPWNDTYYYRSTVTRFLQLMALVFEFEHEAVFVDSKVAEPGDRRFVIYARVIRFAVTDVRLFYGARYAVGQQTDHFFTDELRRVCAALTADDHQVDLDRLSEVLRGKHRLAPVMRYFDGIRPGTLQWDRLFALQLVLLAFMRDFGHPFQRAEDAAFEQAAAQIATPTVVHNLRFWLPRIGSADLESNAAIVRALGARGKALFADRTYGAARPGVREASPPDSKPRHSMTGIRG